MASTKVKAFVLESKDSKEKDKLATLFTLESGRLFVNFRGVRGPKAKLRAAKEVFTFGEYIIEETKAGNIVVEAEIIDNFAPIRSDLEKYYEVCSVFDIVRKVLSTEADPAMFIELVKVMKAICYDGAPKNYALVKFLIDIFDNAGYSLNFEKCSSCGSTLTGKKFLNLQVGEFVCSNCKLMTSIEVAPPTLSALKILKATPFEKLKTIKLGGEGAEKALNLLSENFEWRYGCRFFIA